MTAEAFHTASSILGKQAKNELSATVSTVFYEFSHSLFKSWTE
jgi:hypothetical protein